MSKNRQLDLFRHTQAGRDQRMSLTDAISLTKQSLQAYGSEAKTWVVGFSGGKDSTTVATLIDHFISTGQIQRPENLLIVYADTLMELPSLEFAADQLLAKLESNGWRVVRTRPDLSKMGTKTERFFVTMLGRGYAPPHGKFRWCTDRLKARKLESTHQWVEGEYGSDFLGIDGIRMGESSARDQIVLASCSSDDGECGQGWFHKSQRTSGYKLSPILHWRLCLVWDWIIEAWAEHGYPVEGVIETYGGILEEDDLGFEPPSGRTGCMGCPLVTTGNPSKPKPDKALVAVLQSEAWSHLSPFLRLSEVYHRLRWDDDCRHFNKRGQKGCLTIAARRWALDQILAMQSESARLALAAGRRPYVLIEPDEVTLIESMLDAGTFPDARRYDAAELAKHKPLSA